MSRLPLALLGALLLAVPRPAGAQMVPGVLRGSPRADEARYLSEVRRETTSLLAAAAEALRRRDPDAVEAIFTPDATVVLPHRLRLEGREPIRRYLAGSGDALRLEVVPPLDLEVSGSLGYAEARFRGDAPAAEGEVLVVLRREWKRWRIASLRFLAAPA